MSKFQEYLEELKVNDIYKLLRPYKDMIKNYRFKDNFLYINFKKTFPGRGVYISVGGKDTMSGRELKKEIKDHKALADELIPKIKKIVDVEDIDYQNGQIFVVSDDFLSMKTKGGNF